MNRAANGLTPEGILNRWHEAAGLWILVGIGSTEVLHIFTSNRLGDVQPPSRGMPVRGYRAKILDENGQKISGAGGGRLFVSGGSTARCYRDNPAKTAATSRIPAPTSRD